MDSLLLSRTQIECLSPTLPPKNPLPDLVSSSTNSSVLAKVGIPSLFAMLTARRLRWLGHVTRMDNSRIPKNLLFSELASGTRPIGRPALRFKDVCKRDLKAGGFIPSELETATSDRQTWRTVIRRITNVAEERRDARRRDIKMRKMQRLEAAQPLTDSEVPAAAYIHARCYRNPTTLVTTSTAQNHP